MIKPPLLAGFCVVLVLLLGAGVYAIRVTQAVSHSIDRHLEESFQIVTSVERIKQASNRLNGAVVMKLGGREDESLMIFEQSAETLSDHLGVLTEIEDESANDAELLKSLKERVNILLSESERVLYRSDEGSGAARFSQLLTPRVMDVSEAADRILNAETKAMLERRDALREQGQRAAALWLGALAFSIGFTLFSVRYLNLQILRPVREVTDAADQVAKGELDQVVPVSSEPEVARLCTAFNRMTAQLRATRAGTSEELMRLHQTMQATLASFPNPFFVLGTDRSIELRNPAADKLAVKLFLDGARKLPPSINEQIDKVLETRQNHTPTSLREALTLQVDNETKFFLPRVLLLIDEQGDTFGVAVVLEDVTNQRLLDEVKTNLLSTVSHELKTPLTSVRMGLHLLLERSVGPLNDKQHDLLRTAKEDSERLLRTLNNLLDLTKLEEERAPLELSDYRIADLVRGATHEVRESLEGQDLEIVEDLAADLPPIRVDREKIDHVFSNFLSNAIKHSPPGGTITIRARKVLEDQIRISVIDEGPGIPPELRDRVFDKFYRVPGQIKSGAGLGLSIAREIAQMHKGNVGVFSDPGSGSEFYVDLPADEAEEKETIDTRDFTPVSAHRAGYG